MNEDRLMVPAAPAGPDTGPRSPLAFRADLYARSYAKHPTRLVKLIWRSLEEAQRCRQAGDHDEAGRWEEKAEALEAARKTLGRCRICGRHLEDPTSIERGIGPECLRKRNKAPGGAGQRASFDFGGSTDIGPGPTRISQP